MDIKVIPLSKFRGEANVGLASQDLTKRGYLEKVANIDILDSGVLRTRKGSQRIYTSNNVHSIWSDGQVILFREGTTLRLFDLNTHSSFSLATGFSSLPLPVCYRKIGDTVYLMDGTRAGIVSGVYNSWSISPVGTVFDFYTSRVFVPFGTRISYTQPFQNAVNDGYIEVGEQITMLAAVNTGLWVGTEHNIYFYEGDTVPFKFKHILDIGVVANTAQKIDANIIDDRLTGLVVLFTTQQGIYMGGEEGYLVNRTPHYSLPRAKNGVSAIRYQAGMIQYIVFLENPSYSHNGTTPLMNTIIATLPSVNKL